MSKDNQERIYKKCKNNGIQFISTKTTNDNELIIREL